MEKVTLNCYDKQHLKITMIKHEETFKSQVHELHRLYRIQKTLMKDARKIGPGPEPGRDDPGNLELTLGSRMYYQKEIKSVDPETSVVSSNVVSHQDRLNAPPWLFRALSLNVT